MVSYETKYTFIAQQKQMIKDWVEYCCVPDQQFESGTISSVYYDAPTLNLYKEKRNGDYIKSKLRLRWYCDLETIDPDTDVNCYLELKRKYGTTRQKERLCLTLAAKFLAFDLFNNEVITDLPSRADELMYLPTRALKPMALIQYHRSRYIDPQSGSRFAIDTGIRCTQVNSDYISVLPPVYLGVGVLEVKGKQTELPASLKPISAYLTKEAFSKYGQCLEHLMIPLRRRI
ncbi:MAG: VTC domain-containing protein [Gammaproteobacteria bacterium]